jgi:hypothetical protein
MGARVLAEIRKLGYVGCYSGLAKFLSPWRQAKLLQLCWLVRWLEHEQHPELSATSLRIKQKRTG